MSPESKDSKSYWEDAMDRAMEITRAALAEGDLSTQEVLRMTTQGLQLVTVSAASREEIKAVLTAERLPPVSDTHFIARSTKVDESDEQKNGKGGRRNGKKSAYNRRA